MDNFYEWLLPFALAFLVSVIIAPPIISRLRRQKIGQTISKDGPKSHFSKAGTPTMGGIIIVVGIFAGSFAVLFDRGSGYTFANGDVNSRSFLAVALLIALYTILGLIDDYLTIRPIRGVRGIASKPKAAIQVIIAALFVYVIAFAHGATFDRTLYVLQKPLLSENLYLIFAVLFIVGMSNFVNITDGLDGLVSGLVAVAAIAFWFVLGFTDAHHMPAISGILWAIAGSCVAFLWFNTNPAKVFMGDTGSLALGVALPAIAIIMHREILMIIICSVFVMDGLSTAIQWAVFKFTRITTGTGRRVFKKSPIHHHFELCGWPEQTVTVRFWIMGVIAAVIAFAGAVYGLW